MKRARRSVTIQDVAKAAGVSISTISRVLNEKGDVSTETYEKVQQVITELGYTSSLAARGMRSHRTNVIGLVMPDVASSYCVEVMQGVNHVIAQHDYDLLIYTKGDVRKFHSSDQGQRHVMLLNGSVTDGVIVVAPSTSIVCPGSPIVTIDPNGIDPNCPAVIATNYEGSLTAMRYLTGLGHRCIAHITGRLELVSAVRRMEGYQDGLTAAGIPLREELFQVGDYTTEVAADCARALLALKERPTAIFAANDMSAIGVYQAAQEAGLRIPEDLSVVGFDNIHDAALLTPSLTTIDQHISEMGALATEMLIRLIEGIPLDRDLVEIDAQLVIRNSCRPLT